MNSTDDQAKRIQWGGGSGVLDLTAPVGRFAIGDQISWDYGETHPRRGVVGWVSEFDSIGADSEKVTSNDGLYYGRLLKGECEKPKCFCHPSEEYPTANGHWWNECQLSPWVTPEPPTFIDAGTAPPTTTDEGMLW